MWQESMRQVDVFSTCELHKVCEKENSISFDTVPPTWIRTRQQFVWLYEKFLQTSCILKSVGIGEGIKSIKKALRSASIAE